MRVRQEQPEICARSGKVGGTGPGLVRDGIDVAAGQRRWPWLAAVSLWATVGFLVLPGIMRWRKSGWHQALAAVAFGVLLFSLVANYGVLSRTDVGFVLRKNAPLFLTPTKEADQVSTLTAGEPARVLRTRGNYYLESGRRSGWDGSRRRSLGW